MTSNRTRRALERMHNPGGGYRSPHAADDVGPMRGVQVEVAARVEEVARLQCVGSTFLPTRRSTGLTARRDYWDVHVALGAENRP